MRVRPCGSVLRWFELPTEAKGRRLELSYHLAQMWAEGKFQLLESCQKPNISTQSLNFNIKSHVVG